jgi:hypothetical protein
VKGQVKKTECFVNPALWHFDQGSCSANPSLHRLRGPLVPDALDTVSNILDIEPEIKKDGAPAPAATKSDNATASAGKDKDGDDKGKDKNGTALELKCQSNDTACFAKFQNASLAKLELQLAQTAEQLAELRKEYVASRRKLHLVNVYQEHNSTTLNATVNATLVTEATNRANKEEALRLTDEAKKLHKEAVKLHPELASKRNGTKGSTDDKSGSPSKFLELDNEVRPAERASDRQRNPKHIRRN